jgi:hypothetical protein
MKQRKPNFAKPAFALYAPAVVRSPLIISGLRGIGLSKRCM